MHGTQAFEQLEQPEGRRSHLTFRCAQSTQEKYFWGIRSMLVRACGDTSAEDVFKAAILST